MNGLLTMRTDGGDQALILVFTPGTLLKTTAERVHPTLTTVLVGSIWQSRRYAIPVFHVSYLCCSCFHKPLLFQDNDEHGGITTRASRAVEHLLREHTLFPSFLP